MYGGWSLIERYNSSFNSNHFTKVSGGELVVPQNYGLVFEAPGLINLLTTKKIKVLGYYTYYSGSTFPGDPNNTTQGWTEISGSPEVYIDDLRANIFAWNILGRICHLLQDMSVPVHTQLLMHPCVSTQTGDSYEKWISTSGIQTNNCLAYNWEFNAMSWNYQDAMNQGGLINVIGTNDPLRYLFYSTNQVTSFFPSQLANGSRYTAGNSVLYSGNNNNDSIFKTSNNTLTDDYSVIKQTIGDISLPASVNHNQIAAICLTFAIRATAGLLYYFASEMKLLPTITLKNNCKWGLIKYQGETYRIMGSSGIGFLGSPGVPISFEAIDQFVTDENNRKKYKRVFENWINTNNGASLPDRFQVANLDYGLKYEAALPKEFELNLTTATYIEPGSGGKYLFNGNDVGENHLKYIRGNSPLVNSTIEAVPPLGWKFIYWSDGGTQRVRTVNITDNFTISATYKKPLATTVFTALANNSQQKIVRTSNGYLHLVYESMNKVWYEMSTDNGVTWEILNGGKPLSTTESKCPAIDNYFNSIIIVFQEGDVNSLSNLHIKVFPSSGASSDIVLVDFNGMSLPPYSKDMNSVVTWGYAGRGMLLSERIGPLSSPGVGYLDFSLGANDNYQFHINNAFIVFGTDTNSAKPTVSYPDEYDGTLNNDRFHIAWQQNTNSGSRIQYCNARYVANALTWTAPMLFPGVLNENHSPSIIARDSTARVVFVSEEEQVGSTVVLRDPENTSRCWTFGSNVFSPTITLQQNNAYFIGWSQQYENTWQNYWLNNSLSSAQIYQIPNVNGRDMQLTNGGTRQSTKAVVLTGNSAPFTFSTVPIWDESNDNCIVAAGVQGAVNYAEGGGVSFEFNLGDVTNDGDPVSFVEADPNYYINTVTELNEYLTTVPFTVSNSSEFFYSVSYSCSNPEVAAQVFADGGGVLFKVELLDNNTSEVLAVYDSVFYSASNAGEHDNMRYQVNCQGIGNRTVRLRLQVQTFVVPGYTTMLGQMLSPLGGDEGGMNKIQGMSKTEQMKFWKANGVVTRKNSKEKAMTFRGEFLENGETASRVTEYELEQNYPNPFNPVTSISYALPTSPSVPLSAGSRGLSKERDERVRLVTLRVYDILGKEIRTLVNEEKTAGRYTVSFNASSLPSGTYFYELRAGAFRAVRKMVVLK